jgi:hypothetical protein
MAGSEYETAKAEKKIAALLEEHRPNVFQILTFYKTDSSLSSCFQSRKWWLRR